MRPILVLFCLLALFSIACEVSIVPASIVPTIANKKTVGTVAIANNSQQAKVIAAESLNVRAGAGFTFPVITVLAHGRQVDVTGACLDGWVRVSFDQGARHVIGFVNAYYLTGNLCQKTN